MFDPWHQGATAIDVMSGLRLSPALLAVRQHERLAALLADAAEGSAFWRRVMKGRDPQRTTLSALPVVGKAELMHHFADWVADPALRLGELQDFTTQPSRVADRFQGRYTVWESSGSSGEPGVFVQDPASMALYDALEALRRHSPRPMRRLLDPLLMGERIAFVGAIGGHFASHVSVERLRRLNPWLAHAWRSFSILQPAQALVDALNRFSPTILAGYPAAAGLLADEAQRGALRVTLQEVWTGGETLSPAARSHIEHVFGCPVLNSYGASEFLPIAWQCGHGRLHANADWVILEAVDAQHRPVPPGVQSHTTLLTNLSNRVQPLIRYDLGDQVTWAPEPCACGCPLPVLDVLGRVDDVLHLPGREGRPVALLPMALTTVLEEEAGVFDFQIEQRDAQTLLLRLGLLEREPGVADRCRQALQAFAERQGAAPVQVELQPEVPVAHGRGGKVPRVVALRG